MAVERPEIIGRQHGDRRQHAEATGAEPHPAIGDDQGGAADFDDDSRYRPQPARPKPEMFLFGNGAGEVEQLGEAALKYPAWSCRPLDFDFLGS